MLTASWGTTLNGWVVCYAWSLFFYGIGVGGEYPMTATSGMENAVGSGKVSTKEDRLHRGRKVTSAFLMQGWGQFANQVILIVLLLVFHHGSGNPPYSELAAQWTYRVSFAIPAVGTLWLVYYRTYKMKAAGKQLAAAKKNSKVTGYDSQSLKLTFTYFGPRMIATAGAWYANDVFFYGNKLFQSEFIKVISPNNSSVMEGWLYNLINVGVSLVGYYLACEYHPSDKVLLWWMLANPHSLSDRQQTVWTEEHANGRIFNGLHPLRCPGLQIQVLHQHSWCDSIPSHVLSLFILQPIRP